MYTVGIYGADYCGDYQHIVVSCVREKVYCSHIFYIALNDIVLITSFFLITAVSLNE